MKRVLIFVIVAYSIISVASNQDEYGITYSRLGEYYDFDTQGSRSDRIKHDIGHGTIKAVTSPFRAIRWGYRGIRDTVRMVKDNTEVFLSDAASIDGNRMKLHQVLEEWEGSEDLKTIMEHDRKKHGRFLFGLPSDAWKLLKNMLYTAGFRIPRAGMRTLKSMVVGTRDCVGS